MNLVNNLLLGLLSSRLGEIDRYATRAEEIQKNCLANLVSTAQNTVFGQKYAFEDIKVASNQDLSSLHNIYKNRVPIHSYNNLKPYIDMARMGEKNVLWPGLVTTFAVSSGTTNDKSKYIPVSREAINDCHYKGGKDLYALYLRNYPDSQFPSSKTFAMGGSRHHITGIPDEIYYGDVSAIIMNNLPIWAQTRRTPNLEIALMSEWEEKLEKMADAVATANVSNISGVPSWMLVFLRRLLEKTGKSKIAEVWPNLEVFFHGGVSFSPYREQFIDIIGKEDIRFVETYNASEGFFAMQDRKLSKRDEQDMLLMLDYGVFYEFVPIEDVSDDGSDIKEGARVLHIGQVELGKNYAIILSTNAGLWRYMIGDTICFTSLSPKRIKVSGRTKNFINTFGEELIVDNADRAIIFACQQTQAEVSDYTAGPIFIDKNTSAHQWLIEFKKEPTSLEAFSRALDSKLQELNSDYEAKRYKDLVLKTPRIEAMPSGTFHAFLEKEGKLGGQHKVPRLFNGRKFLDKILDVVKNG